MSMYFGMTGRARTKGDGHPLPPAVILVALVMALATNAGAQDGLCELPLTVPEVGEVELTLQPNSRGPGILVSWPEPAAEGSTCRSLIDTTGVGIPVDLTGFYTDQFDRTLTFTFNTSGTVSSGNVDRFVCRWNNANISRTGRIGGEINLSNSGGLWLRDGGGTWTQRNAGLPVYLPYTNLVDMAAGDDGVLMVVVSRGAQPRNDPQGVYRFVPGGAWEEVGAADFGRRRRLTSIAMRPSNSDLVAVGGRSDGLFVSSDGGTTFERWTRELDPDFGNPPASFEVTALSWTETRLLVSVLNFGSFVSTDDGANFSRIAALGLTHVRSFEEDPGNSDRIVAGINSGGVRESVDGGATWTALNGNMPGGSALPTVLTVDLDPGDPAAIVIGTLNQGIWFTTDRGANWFEATTPFDDDQQYPIKPEIWDFVRDDGILLGMADGFGLLESADEGQTWTLVPGQPANRKGRRLLVTDAGLLRPSYGGGIYLPFTPVPISASQTAAETDPQYLGLDFGMSIAFGPGTVTLVDNTGDGEPDPRSFRVVGQTYQGWIVWRSERGDPDNMAMIGRFDKNNPETCIEGYCGDDSFVQLPNCFSERRAACFTFDGEGKVSFFDGDVYNGFTYFYSVTPFDYGDVSLITDPISLTQPLIFPGRFPGDPQAEGDGNRQSFQVNAAAEAALDGQEIYVYPNPLRREAGIAGSEGEEVIWTNLPPLSKIEVFTLAGDHVATLPEESSPQQGGNIYWITRNDAEELLSAGIYIWRVIMPERGDFWGKLVIIR
jgi:photosystem II stability/assembly factor-like uncharacterized protein